MLKVARTRLLLLLLCFQRPRTTATATATATAAVWFQHLILFVQMRLLPAAAPTVHILQPVFKLRTLLCVKFG
jgi:hypothetical protein